MAYVTVWKMGPAYAAQHAATADSIQAVLVLDNGTGMITGQALQGRNEDEQLWKDLLAPVSSLGAKNVRIDYGFAGWGGPCPPSGTPYVIQATNGVGAAEPLGPQHNLNAQYNNCTACHVKIHGSHSSPVFFR